MNKKKIIIAVLIVCLVVFIGVVAAGLSGALDEEPSTIPETSTSNVESTSDATENTTEDSGVLHGELINVTDNYDIDKTAVIKVKINKSYSNKTTIDQNYYNVADLIQKRGFEKYTELQYWAVADMNDGSEQKVISFTLNADTIQKIYNKEIVDNQIGSYTEELWVHPSLEN